MWFLWETTPGPAILGLSVSFSCPLKTQQKQMAAPPKPGSVGSFFLKKGVVSFRCQLLAAQDGRF